MDVATPTETTFSDILHAPVLDTLSHHLEIDSIIALTRTSRSLSGFYESMTPRKWNVDRSLRRFVDHPRRFRGQIALAEALVAGEFPQEFFEPHVGIRAGTLDLVTMTAGTERLVLYLISTEGYAVDVPMLDNAVDAPYRPVESVVHLRRTYPNSTTTRETTSNPSIPSSPPPPTIRIFTISPFSFPLRAVLESSWTTAALCFMSYRRAYSVFPGPTYLTRTSFLLSQPTPAHAPAAAALLARGYRLETAVSAHATAAGETGHPLQKCRKIGDRFCWTIGFDGLVEGVDVVVGWEALDPVRTEDFIHISERKYEVRGEDGEGLRACGMGVEIGGEPRLLHHYDAKLMRWSKIFC